MAQVLADLGLDRPPYIVVAEPDIGRVGWRDLRYWGRRWWVVRIPELDDHVGDDGRQWGTAVTQARGRGEIEVMARDLIALMTDTEPTNFDVEIRYV